MQHCSTYITFSPEDKNKTYPLSTPRTKLSIKNEPRIISGTKYIQLNSTPYASFICKIKTEAVWVLKLILYCHWHHVMTTYGVVSREKTVSAHYITRLIESKGYNARKRSYLTLLARSFEKGTRRLRIRYVFRTFVISRGWHVQKRNLRVVKGALAFPDVSKGVRRYISCCTYWNVYRLSTQSLKTSVYTMYSYLLLLPLRLRI